MSDQRSPSPNLRRLKNLAKQLHKHWLAGDPAAVQELRLLHPSFELLPVEQLATKMCLHNAQLALARKCCCLNWKVLCARVAVLHNIDLSGLTPEQISNLLTSFLGGSAPNDTMEIAAVRAEKLARYEQGRPYRENGVLYISKKQGLTLEEALNDTAKIHDMPPVGSRYPGAGGIEWAVMSYGYFVAPPTTARYPDDCDYLPIVMPHNISQRLIQLLYEVDHCTSKQIVLLDTMPEKHPFGLGKNLHCANMNADPSEVRLFLDAKNAHQTLIAHELMHLWMWFVEGNEGEKTLKDRSDNARKNQLDFIQSFVLDIRVNDLIEKRGFDMSLIAQDQVNGLVALRKSILIPEFTPNLRERLLYSLQIAGAVLEQKRWTQEMQIQLAGMLEFFEVAVPKIYGMALQLVEIVSRQPLDTRDAMRKALDECTMLGFQFTGDNLDLERDFKEVAPTECMHDKFPNELTKYAVPLKLEIWKAMSRLGIEGYGQVHVNTAPSGMAVLTIEPEDGNLIGPIHLNYRMAPPDWIIEHERERALHEQKKLSSKRAPVDPSAPYRHIPYNERPRVRGMIPDDFGRLPGDNGCNTSYPLGQDPFSQMQNANNHMRLNGADRTYGQNSASWNGSDPRADQYGRLPGQPGYNSGLPPRHPALPQSNNSVSWKQADPAPGGQPVFPWLDTNRGYMAGLTRSIAEARLAQQMAASPTNFYQYADNNPVTHIDPSGLEPQRRGGKAPQAQIGIGGSGNKCPGPAAVQIARRLITKNTHCRLTFEVTCSGHSFGDILSQVQFDLGKPDCDGNPACTRFKLHHDPFDIPGPCDPKSICFSVSDCKKGSDHLANHLIYEIGNWCGCKYHQEQNERPAINLCRACGYSERQCRAATMP